MKLFIIGNGFDCAHKMETEYKYFIEFLEKEYKEKYAPAELEMREVPPEAQQMPDGEIEYDEQEMIEFIVTLLTWTNCGNQWNELEAALGRLNYSIFLRQNVNDFKDANDNEDVCSPMQEVAQKILNYLCEWAENLNTLKAVKKDSFVSLIDLDDVFLTFNYTQTLEEIYGVPQNQICHIHGLQGRDDLIFGHGDDTTEDNLPFGAEQLELIKIFFRKDTKQAFQDHIRFFEQLQNNCIEEIYSYGFGFGDVDLFYIEKIMQMCNGLKKISWRQNSYPESQQPGILKAQEKIIQSCGYMGKFGKPFD